MSAALDAVEESVQALAQGDVAGARIAISEAVARDPALAGVADAVFHASSELEREEEISASTWNGLADALVGTELDGLVETVRT